MGESAGQTLNRLYEAMMRRYGPQSWWPARTPFEVIVGAVLVQNTSWTNVATAIARLDAAGALTPAAIHALPHDRLAELIRPAGYYNVKARRLANLVAWMVQAHGGEVERMKAVPPNAMREQLLDVHGVGPETADSIMLYALGHPRFVVDAYTFRIVVRHGLLSPPVEYEELQALFEDHLPADAAVFNEFHALLVQVGKNHCKPRARCEGCPLEEFPHDRTAC